MRAVLQMEFKRAFKNWGFLLIMVVGCIVAWLAFYKTRDYGLPRYWNEYLNGNRYRINEYAVMDTALEVWMPNSNAANKYFYMFLMFIPVLAAIPYGAGYLMDVKTGYVNQIAIRCKKSHYYVAKLITVFVSGGTVAVVPFIANLILCMCYLPWGTPTYATFTYPVGKQCVFSELYYTRPELYVLIYILRIFVLFGLINCICLVFVYFEDNVFAIIFSPFILCYASSILFKYATGNGGKSLLGNANMIYFYKPDVFAWIVQMIILAIIVATFLIRIKKDIVH